MTDYANKKTAAKAARRQGYDASMIDLHQNDAGRWEFSLKDNVMDMRSEQERDEAPGVAFDEPLPDTPEPPEPEAQPSDADPADDGFDTQGIEHDALAIPSWLRRETGAQHDGSAPDPDPEPQADEQPETPPAISLAEYAKMARERRGKGPVLAALRDAARPEAERKERKQRGPFREGSRGKQLIDLAQRGEGVSIGEMKALGLKDPTTQLRDTAKRLGMKHRIVKGDGGDETRYFVYTPEPEADEPEAQHAVAG